MSTAAELRTDDAAWDRFVADASAPSFLQATPWAAVKRPNGWRAARIVVDAPSGRFTFRADPDGRAAVDVPVAGLTRVRIAPDAAA